MSIINEALKKLQNQIDDNGFSQSSVSTLAEKNDLTATQQEGFRSTMTEEPISTQENSAPKPASKPPKTPQESHLTIILIVLCLLTGLFAPIFNKQSIVSVAYQQIAQFSNHFHSHTSVEPETTPSYVPSATKELPNAMAIATQAAQSSAPVQPTAVPAETVKPLSSESPAVPAASPANKPLKSQSRLIINGIMTQGEKNLVLIDGQIYEEGDSVDGVKILTVTPKGVNVLENGEERFIKVMGL